MVSMISHRERMRDLPKRLGSFASTRKPHLAALAPLEEVVRSSTSLPWTYDVSRTQPPYFHEFAYTEAIGGLMIAPQSAEIAARLVEKALTESSSIFDPLPGIWERHRQSGTLDKYDLKDPSSVHRKVAFLPGSNLFASMVSREALTRLMHEDSEVVIKPHPLTEDNLLACLGIEFGYHRILEPGVSGFACLFQAQQVYATSATELALYAALLGRPVTNIGNVQTEARGAYHPLFRLIAGRPGNEARDILTRVLKSPYSGVFWPHDPEAQARIATYVGAALELRQFFKPLVCEEPRLDWAARMSGSPKNADR